MTEAPPQGALSLAPEGPIEWIALGGGPTPSHNEVSIEQDVALAAKTLGPHGRILFAGGQTTRSVQVHDENLPWTLKEQLGSFFAPRPGRQSRYRQTTLPVHAPADLESLSRALTHAASASGPLVLYVAGHGEMGSTPRENFFDLWGSTPLTVEAFTETLDRLSTRQLCLVASTCYGGGFAEMIFTQADPGRGATPHPRCGLFAAPDDLPAAGCDPNLDRKRQEGFALHFFPALEGRSRNGDVLPKQMIDFDADGQVSLLEAHAYTRIASASADVPTTTSERWLRHVDPMGEERIEVSLPEERAVVEALLAKTGVETPLVAKTTLQRLDQEIYALEEARTAAMEREDQTYQRASAALLNLWPVLDDPWHPDFESLLREHHHAIEAAMQSHPEVKSFYEAQRITDEIDGQIWALRLRAAPLERLVRAAQSIEAAERLAAAGGADWEVYQRLLACERTVPARGEATRQRGKDAASPRR